MAKVFIEIGGYLGDGVQTMLESDPEAEVYVFEPCREYIKALEARFKGNRRVRIYPYGISGVSLKTVLNKRIDASSVYPVDGEYTPEACALLSIFCITWIFDEIDLLQINCEGSEYDILAQILCDPGELIKIKKLHVQFHATPTVDFKTKYLEIVDGLKRQGYKQTVESANWETWER